MAEAMRDPQVDDVRQFSAVISVLGDGQANADIMAQLLRVLESVKAQAVRTSKESKGLLTLKIPINVDEEGVVRMGYDVTIKEPKPPRRGSVLWMRHDGRLSLRDPKQLDLGFRVVNGGDVAPSRDVTKPQPTAQDVT